MENKVEATGRIRITRIPTGEAPDTVRSAWLGVELPALPYILFSNGRETGVMSGKRDDPHTHGFLVPQREGILALAATQPFAAVWWWGKGYPKEVSRDHGYFFFKTTDAEVVSGVDTTIRPIMVADDMEMGFFELPGR